MTHGEAAKVFEIFLTADGHCDQCACELICRFVREFPELAQWSAEWAARSLKGSYAAAVDRAASEVLRAPPPVVFHPPPAPC